MNTPPTVVSLFSGIGALDLAFVWAGFDIVAQVEIDPYCQKVLRKLQPVYFPNSVILGDAKHVGRQNLPFRPTAVIGGVPCQPASHAGRRKGESDDRWLWPDTLRIVEEIQPQICLFENVAGLRTLDGGRPFREILRRLAGAGYDAWWRHLRASDVGAPHRRKRIFLVAYAQSSEWWASDPRTRALVGDGSISTIGEEIAGRVGISSAERLASADRRRTAEAERKTRSGVFGGIELAHTSSSERGQGNSQNARLAAESGSSLADAESVRSRSRRTERQGQFRQSEFNGNGELADTSRKQQADQPISADQTALGSPITGAGSGVGARTTSQGIRVNGRTIPSGSEDVGNATIEGLSQSGQPELTALETESAAGLVIQPERSGGKLGHAESASARYGHDDEIDTIGDNPTTVGTAGTSVQITDGGTTQCGLGGKLDGLADWMDSIRRSSVWPARPGYPQFSWEAPRTTIKQRNRGSRLKALGNAVVWQVAAPIAACIYTYLEETNRWECPAESEQAKTADMKEGAS